MKEHQKTKWHFTSLLLAAWRAVSRELRCSRRPPLLRERRGIVPTMVNAAAKAKINVQPIRRNISVLEGSGGNIAVLTGTDGKLLVEAGFAVSRPAITDALGVDQRRSDQASDQHSLAHRSHRRQRLAARRRGRDHRAREYPQTPFGGHACGRLELDVSGGARRSIAREGVHAGARRCAGTTRESHLKYYGPAHTDSDIWVNFTDADVVHVGDTWWNGVYPFIDYSTGGSIDGQIQAAEANLRRFTSKTIVHPRTWAGGRQVRGRRVSRHAGGHSRERGRAEETGHGLWTKPSPPNRLPLTTRNGGSF